MRAVDLFAGCGGLSLGLEYAGIEVVAAFENWEPAIKLYNQNFEHKATKLDLSDEEAAVAAIAPFVPNMIAGGPPCQDFSSAGKRDEDGGRGDLTLSYARIVSAISPDWFVMENVERIEKTAIFKAAKQIFLKAGYGITEAVLDASYCGVPQKRKRMFLIGKKGEGNEFLKPAIQAALSKEPMTVKAYLGDEINTRYYYRHARSYARRGVFSVDEPSPTIRGVNRPIPPEYKFHVGDASKVLAEMRPLTSKERARIQTFPKDFNWTGPTKSVLEQIIGNAVPVNLAKFVGTLILKYEDEKSIGSVFDTVATYR
jgi:DNA (cytosine-5)-methyltransferase 1